MIKRLINWMFPKSPPTPPFYEIRRELEQQSDNRQNRMTMEFNIRKYILDYKLAYAEMLLKGSSSFVPPLFPGGGYIQCQDEGGNDIDWRNVIQEKESLARREAEAWADTLRSNSDE